MTDRNKLTPESFEALLDLFSEDREVAAREYESLRSGLERYFQFKGGSDPTGLANETIDRVASKIEGFDRTRNARPTAYFYGFASKILLEDRRASSREVELSVDQHSLPAPRSDTQSDELRLDCLDTCVRSLNASEKDLFVGYYVNEPQDRKLARHRLCERNVCSPAALYTKIFRVKTSLRTCIENCVSGKL